MKWLKDVLIGTPSDRDVLTYEASSGLWKDKKPIRIVEVNLPGTNITATSWQAAGFFLFPGTNEIGAPNQIKIHLSRSCGMSASVSVRVLNKSVIGTSVICQKTFSGFCALPVTPKNMGTLSNLPAGDAVFQVQAQVNTGGNFVQVHALGMRW